MDRFMWSPQRSGIISLYDIDFVFIETSVSFFLPMARILSIYLLSQIRYRVNRSCQRSKTVNNFETGRQNQN